MNSTDIAGNHMKSKEIKRAAENSSDVDKVIVDKWEEEDLITTDYSIYNIKQWKLLSDLTRVKVNPASSDKEKQIAPSSNVELARRD